MTSAGCEVRRGRRQPNGGSGTWSLSWPSEVVVKHLSEPRVLGQPDIRQGLVEADDCAAVHLMVLAVATVHPHDRGLLAKGVGVCGRPAECLGPIGGQSLAVLGVESVAERVADHLVGHHSGVPRTGRRRRPSSPPAASNTVCIPRGWQLSVSSTRDPGSRPAKRWRRPCARPGRRGRRRGGRVSAVHGPAPSSSARAGNLGCDLRCASDFTTRRLHETIGPTAGGRLDVARSRGTTDFAVDTSCGSNVRRDVSLGHAGPEEDW